jgi:AcrR family transcriptional regulator
MSRTYKGGHEKLKLDILRTAIKLFNKNGLKFTMDNIASDLSISKKSIYLCFSSKNELFEAIVNHIFDSIQTEKKKVMEDSSLTTVEKLRKILSSLPKSYREMNLNKLYSLKDNFPETYALVEERLETGWEDTIALIEKGKKEGVIRDIDVNIFKLMFQAALEQFFQKDILVKNRISYTKALNEVVEILIDGISVRS